MSPCDRATIRMATKEDIAALARVHVAAFHAAYGHFLPTRILERFTVDNRRQVFEQLLADDVAHAVALLGDEVVGISTFGPCRDEDLQGAGEIWGMYVHPRHWRAGVGRALARWTIERLGADGHDIVSLWVHENNTTAIPFYERLGFQADGARREVVEDVPWAARYRLRLETGTTDE